VKNAAPRPGNRSPYLLTEESFDSLLDAHPHIGQALLTSIARQLANRLRDTLEELRSLSQ
jgi:sulfate permease, SulP family